MANAALQVKPKDFEPHTGIEKGRMEAIAQVLRMVLADSFTLYLKTLGVHWNVVGPSFFGLHKLTQAQYEDLAAAIDALPSAFVRSASWRRRPSATMPS